MSRAQDAQERQCYLPTICEYLPPGATQATPLLIGATMAPVSPRMCTMQTDLLIQLSPLKPLFCGLLFFWTSWMATKKFLLISMLGVSAGETTWHSLHGQAEAISTNPYVMQAASAAGVPVHGGSVLAPLISNTLMALAMLSLVQAMKIYTRAKRMEMETELRIHEIHSSSRIKPRHFDKR